VFWIYTCLLFVCLSCSFVIGISGNHCNCFLGQMSCLSTTVNSALNNSRFLQSIVVVFAVVVVGSYVIGCC